MQINVSVIPVFAATRTWQGIADDDVVYIPPTEGEQRGTTPFPLVARREVLVCGIRVSVPKTQNFNY